MNPSPLPQPSAQTCPNCGAAADEGINFCPNCGVALSASARKTSWASTIGQICLAFVALCSGLFGACFALLGVTNISSSYGAGSETLFFLGIAGVSLALAVFCVRRMIEMSGRR